LKDPCCEAEALSYFFAGEANRATASHILNKSSSRSHCIFTVYLESRASGDGADKTTGRGSPRHPAHRVPVLATPSTAWCTGARHAIHHTVYRCSRRRPPHRVPLLATPSTHRVPVLAMPSTS
jgi:hypothetical protein